MPGANALAPAGSSASLNGGPATFDSASRMNATELDRRIAAALEATAGRSGPCGDTVNRLNIIHEALKAQRASGLLTDEEYAKEAGGLLNAITFARLQYTK